MLRTLPALVYCLTGSLSAFFLYVPRRAVGLTSIFSCGIVRESGIAVDGDIPGRMDSTWDGK